MDRNAPITSKDVFLKRSAKTIDGTVKPKIPLNFLQKAQCDTKNLAISRDFFGYSKLIFLFFALYHFTLPGNFYYQGTSACMHKQKKEIDNVRRSNKIPFFIVKYVKKTQKILSKPAQTYSVYWVYF